MLKFVTVIVIGFLMGIVMTSQAETSINDIYLEAKKQSFEQNWRRSSELYRKLVDIPGNQYHEEASFWMGYCLEKAGKNEKAFNAFKKLRDLYPKSLWLDDAIQHQVTIAEQLATESDDKYVRFLREQLNNENVNIRLETAKALARLGDTKALPVLKSLKDVSTFNGEAEQLIEKLELQSGKKFRLGVQPTTRKRQNRFAERSKSYDTSGKKEITIFSQQRFEQYQNLTQTTDDWSQDELYTFGLWHILPTTEFDEYQSKSSQDKEIFLKIFWKKLDPTPTTEKNEAEIEFEHRVRQAHEKYTYFDNLKNFHYAPWDARGEMLIKFGTPDVIKKNRTGEYWTFEKLDNLTFFIRKNVTNIFGRAIFVSAYGNIDAYKPMSALQWRTLREHHNKYIFTPCFSFSTRDLFDYINGFEVKEIAKKPFGIVLQYQLPVNECGLQKKEHLYHLDYLERYVVFDKNMNMALQHEASRSLTKPTRRDFDKMRYLSQEISLNLQPGRYMAGVRVEDISSHKVGIKKVHFEIGAD